MPDVISPAAPPATPPEDDAPARRTAGQRAIQVLDAAWRPALLLLLLGFGWWAVTAAEVFPAYLVPTPGDVARELVEEREMLARHTWVTTYETVLGFLLAAAIGLLAAVLIVYSPTLEKALYPLILFAQVIPKIAIAPILVVWFGFGPMPKVILAVLIAFFPIVVSGVAGLRSTDPELLDLSATMGASRWKTFRKIRFPNALPHLLSGLKVAVTLAVVGAVVGEFVGADEGLGYVLLLASGNLNSSLLFADLILMSALGVVLFVVVEVAEKLLIPWHASRRQGVPLTTS
ncbi:ABC transporter permease [Jiangella alba]|uniref:NitT/TauT family transport system permease protein n=1 Tax=Jiangella alba TaxID=561176 RepID=A0A1H5DF11_9ACTN|nr:ABC transporter permease [Jiangella alba]SED77426.1 NitT/TauT family transport system permease protein [Jiangella alba]